MMPVVVQDDVNTAQFAYDLSLFVSLLLSLFFLPFLMVLVVVQTQNFMFNQTTNTRFSKHRRNHVSDAQLAALAGTDSSEEDFSAFNSFKAPTSMRSRASRDSSLNEHSSLSPYWCGGDDSAQQRRFMKKITSDPNQQINQPSSSSAENTYALLNDTNQREATTR